MGRPMSFDKELALEKATQLFINKGYAATSLSELIAELGIVKPSFYNAFGNKKGLLLQVMDHYYLRYEVGLKEILSQSKKLSETLDDLFQMVLDNHQDNQQNPGCLIVSCANECHDGEIKEKLLGFQENTEKLLRVRIELAVDKENLSLRLTSQELAVTISTFLRGIASSYQQTGDFEKVRQSLHSFRQIIFSD